MKLTGHRCKCAGCGNYFSRASVFDKHRTGPYTDRRCMTDLEMTEAGLRAIDGIWKGQPRSDDSGSQKI